MQTSIRIRLLFSHLAVIVLAMGLSGALLLTSLERYFLQAMEESLLAQARITAQSLLSGATTAGPEVMQQAALNNTIQQRQVQNLALQTQNLVQPPTGEMDLSYLANSSLQLGTQLDTRIRVVDAQGVVWVDSWSLDTGQKILSDSLVAQALTGESATRVDTTSAGGTMWVATPMLAEGRRVGVVYLSQPLRDVVAVLQDLRMRWLLSTTAALLLSVVVGLILSGAITRPLRQLTAAAGAVAQGRFDLQVPIHSRDELGRLSRAFNDMTAQLQAARQMQVDFVANVSHELRTPLTSIKGMVETLRDGAVDDPEVRDRFLETTEQETDRMIRLVNDLLLLSRADSEALNLRREAVDLVKLVRDTAGRLAPQAEGRELTLQVAGGESLPAVWADRDRIAQVVLNLLDNALKYSRPGGTVRLQIGSGDGRTARVEIRDEGIGIAAADLPRIGQRFYRADKARSRAQGGSGLGLAIAQSLVAAHGGALELESREGVGTVVSFTLPLA